MAETEKAGWERKSSPLICRSTALSAGGSVGFISSPQIAEVALGDNDLVTSPRPCPASKHGAAPLPLRILFLLCARACVCECLCVYACECVYAQGRPGKCVPGRGTCMCVGLFIFVSLCIHLKEIFFLNPSFFKSFSLFVHPSAVDPTCNRLKTRTSRRIHCVVTHV